MLEFRPLASSSSGNCYYVSDGKTPILIELGMKFREIRKQLNFKTSEIVAALVTHSHGDHSRSMADAMKAGIDVYASEGTFESIGLVGHRKHIISAHKKFVIGTWHVVPFDVEHDAEEPLGFLLSNAEGEKIAFITDSYYCRYRFEGLSIIAIECNYSIDILDRNILEGRVPQAMRKRLLRSHMSLDTAKDFLKANDLSKVQEIHLIHLSDTNSDEARFKREIQELTGKQVLVARR